MHDAWMWVRGLHPRVFIFLVAALLVITYNTLRMLFMRFVFPILSNQDQEYVQTNIKQAKERKAQQKSQEKTLPARYRARTKFTKLDWKMAVIGVFSTILSIIYFLNQPLIDQPAWPAVMIFFTGFILITNSAVEYFRCQNRALNKTSLQKPSKLMSRGPYFKGKLYFWLAIITVPFFLGHIVFSEYIYHAHHAAFHDGKPASSNAVPIIASIFVAPFWLIYIADWTRNSRAGFIAILLWEFSMGTISVLPTVYVYEKVNPSLAYQPDATLLNLIFISIQFWLLFMTYRAKSNAKYILEKTQEDNSLLAAMHGPLRAIDFVINSGIQVFAAKEKV